MCKEKTTYINPLTDFGFKRLFGQEENKKYLISFLNALLGENIENVTYTDKENTSEAPEDRGLIYDVRCTTADNRTFIVEMQNRYQDFFDDRALFYIMKDMVSQARKGKEWLYQLTPVYGIFMMNFDWRDYRDAGPLSGRNEHLCEQVALMNITTGKLFSEKVRMFFLKLPLMEKTPEECENIFDIWIYLLKNLENMDAMPTAFSKHRIFDELGESARIAALTKKEREDYDKSLKIYRDNYAIAQTERRLGKEEGRAEGRAEEQRYIALNLLRLGIDIDSVSKGTGLSVEEILKIKNADSGV